MSDERWVGRGWLRPGLMVLEGVIGTARPHAHHTVQVITAVDGIVLGDGKTAPVECMAAVVPPDTVHEVVRGAAIGRVVHVAPDSVAGGRLLETVRITHGVDGWVRAGDELCSDTGWFTKIEQSMTTRSARHPAVVRVLALLPQRLEAGPVRLAELARTVGLSESRLAHVFSEELGLPLRPYVRWLRMQRAIRFVAEGHSLTDAAHGAGFADSSHLTRVCHSMFGGSPSDFARLVWDTTADRP